MTKLYIISPPQIELDKFTTQLERALAKHQHGLFQLRLKDIAESEILAAAEKLVPICQKAGVKFIMNDSVELALKCGADGVHLGMDDFKATGKTIAQICQKLHLGLSCYNNLEYALDAASQNVDLVCFGAFYHTTTTKPKAQAELATLLNFKARNKSATKVAAIGGINFANKEPLEKAGADYICMVSAIWG